MGFTKSTTFGALWTKEEDETVKEAFARGGRKAVCEALPHRTLDAIIAHVRKLGLSGRHKGHWTRDEDTRLRSLWGVEPMAGLAKLLDRTPRAIYNRAVNRLGLEATVPEGWEHVTHAAARTGYGVDSLYRILKEANIHPMRAYSATRERYWIVEIADVDFAVSARGDTESLFGAATRRGMSAEKLRLRLEHIGVVPPKRKAAKWLIKRTDLQRVLSKAEYEGLIALIIEKKTRTSQSHIPMDSIERAGVDTTDLRARLAAIGIRERVRKDVWRIRTEDIERALVTYDEDRSKRETIAQAAKRLGINAETMTKWLKKHGVVFKRRQPILRSEVERVRAIEQANPNGEMVTDAAKRLGLHYGTLATWLKKNGIPYVRGMRVPAHEINRIAKKMLYRPEGETVSQAAKRIVVQPETLAKWLKRHGVAVVQGSPIPTSEIDRVVAIMRPPVESVVTVAERLGVHPGTLRIWLRAEGIEIRKGFAYQAEKLLSGDEVQAVVSHRRAAA